MRKRARLVSDRLLLAPACAIAGTAPLAADARDNWTAPRRGATRKSSSDETMASTPKLLVITLTWRPPPGTDNV